MAFDFKNLFLFLFRSFQKSDKKHYQLSLKRLMILFFMIPLYVFLEIIIWVSLALDKIFFPKYSFQPVEKPIFIIGNPRSGTTLLYRNMAKDENRFTCFKTWEIVLAPSIILRNVLGKVSGTLIGFRKFLTGRNKDSLKFVFGNKSIHKIDFMAPEEDGYTLIHIFATIGLWAYSIHFEILEKYIRFDSLPEIERKRIMRFYKGIVKRHLYVHGGKKQLLSKTPFFTPMIASLNETFPDARFIYLVRNPMEVVPSHISLMTYSWKTLSRVAAPYIFQDETIRMAKHWYDYAFEALTRIPEERVFIVQYDGLRENLENCILSIYSHFGMHLDPAFVQILQKESSQASGFTSKHYYDLEEMGLSRERIKAEFASVFSRFEFSVQAPVQRLIVSKAHRQIGFPGKRILKRQLNQIPWKKRSRRFRLRAPQLAFEAAGREKVY